MKNFLSSSLLFLLLACSRPLVRPETYYHEKISPVTIHAPFSNGFKSYFFKTQADIYGQYLSGLLLIKPFGDTSYRVIFTTEVGIKLFDFEFIEEKMVVHYCMDKLNRKPVIKILERDFRLLLLLGVRNKEAGVRAEQGNKVYVFREEKESFCYYYNQKLLQIDTMTIVSDKGKPKVHVLLNDYKNNFPTDIMLVHDNIKLTIGLKYIER